MKKFKEITNEQHELVEIETSLYGKFLLSTPELNKGSAFSLEERKQFSLIGKLPCHIETLDEIDIEFRGYAEEVVDYFERSDCFNLEEEFIDLCVRLVSEHIDSDYLSEIRPCCVNCEGYDCSAMRQYFRSSPVYQTG